MYSRKGEVSPILTRSVVRRSKGLLRIKAMGETPVAEAGSNPADVHDLLQHHPHVVSGPVAQLDLERTPTKREVEGSSPSGITIRWVHWSHLAHALRARALTGPRATTPITRLQKRGIQRNSCAGVAQW